MSKPAGPFPRPDATAPGDNEWWENCVPKNTRPRPKARTRDATSSGSEGSADPAGFRRGGGGPHLPAPARGLRVRGGGRRQDTGLKPTYCRRCGCGPTSRFMPLSSAPVDARPSMCLRCFERNEFHVSLSQTSPIGGAFAPGSQAQPPSPWTVARPRRLAPQARGRRDLPPLASPRLPRLCGAPSSFACASPCVGRGHWGARPRDSHKAPRRDAGEGQTSVWVTQGHRDIQGTLDLPPLIRRPPVASPRGAAAQTGWKAMEMK